MDTDPGTVLAAGVEVGAAGAVTIGREPASTGPAVLLGADTCGAACVTSEDSGKAALGTDGIDDGTEGEGVDVGE